MAERILPFELVAAGGVFAILILRRARRQGAPIQVGRATWFNAALCTLALALVSPIDSESARSLPWHMTQHLLIVSVAAPLLAVTRPVELVVDALPQRFARRRPPRWGPWSLVVVVLTAPATLFAWHIPALYQAALSNGVVHVIEHASLLVTAVALWSALLRTRHAGASVLWLFVGSLPVTGFGVAMTIARTPWYANYVTDGRANAVRDQQLAGVIMWAFGGLATLAGGVGLFASWLVHASSTTADPAPLGTAAASVPRC